MTILIVQFLAFGGALVLGRLAGASAPGRRCWSAWSCGPSWWSWPRTSCRPARPCRSCCSARRIGIVLGGSQALSRSLFSQLIPKGKEAEYFGFYEISDKGTSWLGPLLFGLAFQLTRNYRVGVISLVVFFVIGFVLLLLVPMRRAIVAAGNTPPRVL